MSSVYNPPQTIWEELASHGIMVDTRDVYLYKATFNCECHFIDAKLPTIIAVNAFSKFLVIQTYDKETPDIFS